MRRSDIYHRESEKKIFWKKKREGFPSLSREAQGMSSQPHLAHLWIWLVLSEFFAVKSSVDLSAMPEWYSLAFNSGYRDRTGVGGLKH